MTLYPAGINPAVSLYNLWLSLLSAQGIIDVSLVKNRNDLDAWNSPRFARVSYGDQHTGIGVWGFDAQQRPIIAYGAWYRPQAGIYAYLAVDADGNFRMVHPHGYNHDRIGQHTFLNWWGYGGQYVWYVSPTHAPGQMIATSDFQTRVPYVRERVLKGAGLPWNQRRDCWNRLLDMGDGRWGIVPLEPNSEYGVRLQADIDQTERAYRKHERKARGTRIVSVRDGKTTLHSEAAALRIAALLDVSQPAKAVPMSKTREVTV